MPSFRGVGGGRDRFPFRNLLTSLPERLARNLCGGCPWRLAAGWRSGETRRADSLPLCAAQGLSESLRAHAVRDLTFELPQWHPETEAVPGSWGGSRSPRVRQIWKLDQRGGARTRMWGKGF